MKTKMLRAVVLAVVVVAALSAPLDVEESFESFKVKHNKKYDGVENEIRRMVFEENKAYIKRHNEEYQAKKHTYYLGTNEFADWTSREFVSFMNGFNSTMKQSKLRRSGPHILSGMIRMPMTVDWREKGYVTPVKNQKQCGSCWSFSATGSLEGQHFKQTGKLVSLSEQNLIDCSRPQGNMGCQGGLMDQAFEYINVNNGVDTEESYPYTAMNGDCLFNAENIGATDTGYMDIDRMDEDALQMAVATVGPISVAIDASRRSFQLYKGGVYSDEMCSSTQLDHGVLAVGYGTSDSGMDYWLVKNSWGATWGMEGYINMARNMNNMCGIATSASYPTVKFN